MELAATEQREAKDEIEKIQNDDTAVVTANLITE